MLSTPGTPRGRASNSKGSITVTRTSYVLSIIITIGCTLLISQLLLSPQTVSYYTLPSVNHLLNSNATAEQLWQQQPAPTLTDEHCNCTSTAGDRSECLSILSTEIQHAITTVACDSHRCTQWHKSSAVAAPQIKDEQLPNKLPFQFVYTVSYRPERFDKFVEQFNDTALHGNIRDMVVRDKLPIVDGKALKRKELVKQGLLSVEDLTVPYGDSMRPMRMGEFACAFAHYNAWKACYDETHKVNNVGNKNKACLIVEDDADFLANNVTEDTFIDLHNELYKSNLLDMYDLIYLGYGRPWYTLKFATTGMLGIPEWYLDDGQLYTMQAYMISKRGAANLVNNSESFYPLRLPSDTWTARQCGRGALKCLQTIPSQLIPQMPNKYGSDTQGIN